MGKDLFKSIQNSFVGGKIWDHPLKNDQKTTQIVGWGVGGVVLRYT